MSKARSIFENVVRHENPTTELLCNLMEIKVFRDVFLKVLLKEHVKDIPATDSVAFETQHTCQHGRPDIVITTDKLKVFVEVKTSARTELTPNQPAGYLTDLTADSEHEIRGVVFLLPRRYAKESTIREEFRAFRRRDEEQRTAEQRQKRPVITRVVCWNDLVVAIEDAELPDFNPLIQEFNKLIRGWLFPVPIEFTKAEVRAMRKTETPGVLIKLGEVVRDVNRRFQNSKDYETTLSGRRDMDDSYEYGLKFYNSDGREMLWFGIWFPFWVKHGKPLCFGVHQGYGESVNRLFGNHVGKDEYKVHDKWVMSWFGDETLDDAHVVDNIVGILGRLLAYLCCSSREPIVTEATGLQADGHDENASCPPAE